MDKESLFTQSKQRVGHLLPKETFMDYAHPNNRMLIAVTLLRQGEEDLAYHLYQEIVAEGPKENPNHHFAFVRSLIDLSEVDSKYERFADATNKLQLALRHFPDSMGYMTSKVHLEVYLAYYLYLAGDRPEALKQIAHVCKQEKSRFELMPLLDAKVIVGPGLCYALHQWALFYVMEEKWGQAISKIVEMKAFAHVVEETYVAEALQLQESDPEAAFQLLEQAFQYEDVD
ncbi:hypothetical protein IC620_15815 [Hazenella sp. IB182357]|uniref:Tetratricopeptide repeat protein n=1 Tax=Polycladospora coralii TaxID=2771432 RepID=A0A926N878_9BACL|nr:hypothetical protein [Polycladospora coralii]MBD1373811.1 hypothetical protein [Polycladospora coralii]MBS7531986.1 hypothetical protein [Polycladospora coralii]